jgi:hypothetical protein
LIAKEKATINLPIERDLMAEANKESAKSNKRMKIFRPVRCNNQPTPCNNQPSWTCRPGKMQQSNKRKLGKFVNSAQDSCEWCRIEEMVRDATINLDNNQHSVSRRDRAASNESKATINLRKQLFGESNNQPEHDKLALSFSNKLVGSLETPS